jgi:putative nucleotidyltransferase with HDIG domain
MLRTYLLAMAAPAVIATALLPMLAPTRPGDPALVALLVLLGAIAANFPVTVAPRYKADPAPAVYFAGVLLFSPALAVAAIGLSGLLGEGALCLRRDPVTGRRKRQPIDLVFNTSQLMLAATASALTYRALGSALKDLPSVALAAVVMYLVSTGLVVVAAGLHTRRNPLEIWTETASADLRQTAALYVAGFLLALVAAAQPWLAVVMMVPVAAINVALQRSMQLQEQTVAALEAMADVVDRRDPYTFQHSQSVADHAVRMARRLKLPEREVELIRLAARVHDLGKIAVPDEVLHKQGRLTEAEFDVMKKHPQTGVEILGKFPRYLRGRELVLAHHERIDGRGYPRGLLGDAIPFGARVIAVADSWDAMTSDRPYRKAMAPEFAVAELMRGRGNQWDADVVDAFVSTLPGALHETLEPGRLELRPLLQSLGAALGVIG